jgi:hypothetical protein
MERRAAASAAGTVIFAENSTVQTAQEESTDHSAGGGSPRSGEAPGGEPIRRIGEEMPAADSKIADQTPRPAIIGHLNVQIVGAGRERDGWQAVRYRPIVALRDQPTRLRAALTEIDDKRIVGGQAAGQCRGASGPCRANGPCHVNGRCRQQRRNSSSPHRIPLLTSQNRCANSPSSVPHAQNTLRAEICRLQGQATVSAPSRKVNTALDSVGRLKRSAHLAPLIWSASWRAAKHLRRPAAQKSFAMAISYPCGIKPQ